jgi:hypothetical protein
MENFVDLNAVPVPDFAIGPPCTPDEVVRATVVRKNLHRKRKVAREVVGGGEVIDDAEIADAELDAAKVDL